MEEIQTFSEQLVRLNATMKELFTSGNVALFTEMNRAVKEMYDIQHASKEPALQAIADDCEVIYGNFNMIIAVLRTTEGGVIDRGAQTALNKFLHNIDEAVVAIASAFGLA